MNRTIIIIIITKQKKIAAVNREKITQKHEQCVYLTVFVVYCIKLQAIKRFNKKRI